MEAGVKCKVGTCFCCRAAVVAVVTGDEEDVRAKEEIGDMKLILVAAAVAAAVGGEELEEAFGTDEGEKVIFACCNLLKRIRFCSVTVFR